jgi:hypothetical protein
MTITVENVQNVYLNRVKHTSFIIRDNGVFFGAYFVKGWNAPESRCIAHYKKVVKL